MLGYLLLKVVILLVWIGISVLWSWDIWDTGTPLMMMVCLFRMSCSDCATDRMTFSLRGTRLNDAGVRDRGQWGTIMKTGTKFRILVIDREAGEIICLVASICLSMCLSIRLFLFGPFELRPSFLAWALTLTLPKYSKKFHETQNQPDILLNGSVTNPCVCNQYCDE